MRWQNERRSDNVEDQRGVSPAGMAVGGGLGTIVIVLLLSFLTGQDPRALLQQVQQQAPPGAARQGPAAPKDPEEEREVEFVRATLAMTEDVWNEQFAKLGKRYEEPKLRLFTGPGQYRGMRVRQRGRRAVLLPGRPPGLPRSRLLR